jgi:hypothetical protein
MPRVIIVVEDEVMRQSALPETFGHTDSCRLELGCKFDI